MPPAKLKPSEIAAEAKKTYIPYIRHTFTQWPIVSYLCHSDSLQGQPVQTPRQYTFAFLERDAVDLALEWASSEPRPIPVIMPAHEKRPGGDWEAGVMQPEECLCRRSTLYASLTTPASDNSTPNNYPIPDRAGIFSENVGGDKEMLLLTCPVVFRSGPEKYQPWSEYKSLPIISVPTVKRPKLDSSGKKYSFKTERELMKASMKTALRIAIFYQYDKIVIGTFGLGPGFKNPPEEVANLWRELLT
ncbi:Mitochondrial chaperone bcs1 protein [Rutstroemia sp. NJR-2017a BVV2]|nr:Mitochondrial chaperone bcs1 protein [Rutstroemia sp. NJR-2017a BVV2]